MPLDHASFIYLDNNATTRPLPEVVASMLPYWTDHFLNPSTAAADVYGCDIPIVEAKRSLAELLNASNPAECILTSGATEANNWVLRSVVSCHCNGLKPCHIIVSEIEHPSVLQAAARLAESNNSVELSLAPVDGMGRVDVDRLLQMVRPETRLVSVMLANNESGVVQPVGELARLVKRRATQCICHTDATQAAGRIPIDLGGDLECIDCLSLSAHKFHGPKGIGALFVRTGVKLTPLLVGGGQEGGMRAGTGNPPLAAGLSTAASAARSGLPRMSGVAALRDMLEQKLQDVFPGLRILGRGAERIPNTSFICLPDMEGEMLTSSLLQHGIIASTGSACSNGSDRPSHVAVAMGLEHAVARNVVRFSLSRYTTGSEIMQCIDAVAQIRSIL